MRCVQKHLMLNTEIHHEYRWITNGVNEKKKWRQSEDHKSVLSHDDSTQWSITGGYA